MVMVQSHKPACALLFANDTALCDFFCHFFDSFMVRVQDCASYTKPSCRQRLSNPAIADSMSLNRIPP